MERLLDSERAMPEAIWIRPFPPINEVDALQSKPSMLNSVQGNGVMIDLDPRLLAIGMTTAPRRLSTLDVSIDSLRRGQFSQTVHLFSEPETLPKGWNRTDVVVHQSDRRLGCFPNWIRSAEWLLKETDRPYLLMLEDDGFFCHGAAAALYAGLTHLRGIGVLSLYTPIRDYLVGGHSETGWFPLLVPDRWGAVALCFPRPVLEQFLSQVDRTQIDGTDRHISKFVNVHQLRWYSHAPSLVDHIGKHSTLGHVSSRENAGVGFRPEFYGFPNEVETNSSSLGGDQATLPLPTVSIVMPIWNSEKYIRQAIESILHQTFQDFELILVNDGSTDGTAIILNELARGRSNVFVIHQRNGGTGAALNAGFQLARGKYQTWWSSDSWVEPNWLQELTSALDQHPDVGFVYSHMRILDENSGNTHIHQSPSFDFEWFQRECYIGVCWLWRTEVKQRCGAFLEHQKCEDYDMHLRMFDVAKAMLVPKVLGTWRQRDGSLSSQCNQNQWRDSRQIVARHKWAAHANCRIANVSPYIDPAGVNYFLSYGLTETQPDFASRHILGRRTALQQSEDLVVGENDDEISRVLDSCDLIHLNLTFPPDDFHVKLNIMPWVQRGKPLLVHLHGGHWQWRAEEFAEFQEQFGAQIVSCHPGLGDLIAGITWMPNWIPLISDEEARHQRNKFWDWQYYQAQPGWPNAVNQPLNVCCHHNYPIGKGVSQIRETLHLLKEWYGLPLSATFADSEPVPLREHLAKKLKYDIVIDQITQGFVGMATWESLAHGAVVIARMDECAMREYTKLGDGTPPPIVNARWIDELALKLLDLSKHPEKICDLKRAGREWMLTYYNARRIAALWAERYRAVLNSTRESLAPRNRDLQRSTF